MIRTLNPYHYGTPATDEHFAGREPEVATLTSLVRAGAYVALLAPRRFGKTSLLLRAEQAVGSGRPHGAFVTVDVLRCRDLAALMGRLVTGAYLVPFARWHRAQQPVPQFLKRLRSSPAVTFDGAGTPRFSFPSAIGTEDADALIVDIWDLLSEHARQRPVALVLDEFQAIADHGAHLPGLLGALASQPGASLVVAGSKRQVMDRLVTAGQAKLHDPVGRLELGPVPRATMVDHLCRRASAGRKSLSEKLAEEIVEVAGPVPHDIQRLAYEAFAAAGGVIDRVALAVARTEAVRHGAAGYAEALGRLSPGQRRVLGSLALAPSTSPYSAAFVARVGLANASSVRKALAALTESEVVSEREGRYEVADPFFSAWLRE